MVADAEHFDELIQGLGMVQVIIQPTDDLGQDLTMAKRKMLVPVVHTSPKKKVIFLFPFLFCAQKFVMQFYSWLSAMFSIS